MRSSCSFSTSPPVPEVAMSHLIPKFTSGRAALYPENGTLNFLFRVRIFMRTPEHGLLEQQQGFALSRCFNRLLIFDELHQFLATLGAANHQHANQLVVTEEEFAIILIPLLSRLTARERDQVRVMRLRRPHHSNIDIKERAGICGHIHIWLVTASHITARDPSMSQSIIPGSHTVMATNGGIKELSNIAGGIDIRDNGFQVFIHDDALAPLYRRVRQKLHIESDAQTNPDQIGLNLAPLFRFLRAGHPVFRDHAFNLVAMDHL